MDKPLSVLLVEDEPCECKAIIQYAELKDNICLIGVTNNADKALEYVRDFLPDAVILDLELHKGSGNGLSFLNELQKMKPTLSPYILVATNNISFITHEKTRQMGADFIMVKSQNDYSAENVIEFLLTLRKTIHDTRRRVTLNSDTVLESPSQTQKRLMSRIASEIERIGISPKATGRKYLTDAILLVINGANQNVCSAIAQKHEKTDASVERAMQNAINAAWRTSDIEDLQRYYTARIGSHKGVPTITEFIYYYADKIKNEY